MHYRQLCKPLIAAGLAITMAATAAPVSADHDLEEDSSLSLVELVEVAGEMDVEGFIDFPDVLPIDPGMLPDDDTDDHNASRIDRPGMTIDD